MALVDLDQRTQYNITTVMSSLQQQLDISQHENQQLKQSISDQNEQYQKDQDYLELRVKGIIQENDSLYATQERLESDLYAKEQELDALHKESQYWKRLHKESNKSLDMEREEFDKDRSTWLQRETQLMGTIRLLQHQRQQKDHHYHHSSSSPKRRNGLLSAHSAPFMEKLDYTPDGGCKQIIANLDSSSHRSPSDEQTGIQSPSTMESLEPENQGTTTTIKAQEGIITTLRTELEQQANKSQQQRLLDNQKVSLQMKNLMAEVDNIKQLNQSLMEENESYQILLHEKTISGEFISDSIVQFEHESQDNYFRHNNMNQRYLPQDHGYFSGGAAKSNGLNLADELAMASSVETNSRKNPELSTEEELLGEIKALQDANRALQLYMNKILLRIVENKHLENILSIDEPSKGSKTTTITVINSSTLPTPLQTPMVASPDNHQGPMDLKHVKSCHSFSSIDEEENMSTLSGDTNTTKATEASDDGDDASGDGGNDSWTQVFRRMSSGFTEWTRSSDTELKCPLNGSSNVEVDYEVRALFFLNK